MKVTAHYDIAGKGGGPAGLAMDVKNHILFAFCHEPATVVILNAEDGKIITTLPIGNGVDAAEFNPNTMEAFSSQGDGTLSVIKEKSPTEFSVEQTVQTKQGSADVNIGFEDGPDFPDHRGVCAGDPARRARPRPAAAGAAGFIYDPHGWKII